MAACPECGEWVDDNEGVCPSCGYDIENLEGSDIATEEGNDNFLKQEEQRLKEENQEENEEDEDSGKELF